MITNYHNTQVDAYLDPTDTSKIYLYRKDTYELLLTIDELGTIPVAIYDRTEEHKFLFGKLAKQATEVLGYFKTDREARTNRLIRTLGFDPKRYSLEAQLKKEESSEEALRKEMDLSKETEDPPKNNIYNPKNGGKRKIRSKSKLESLGINLTNTF